MFLKKFYLSANSLRKLFDDKFDVQDVIYNGLLDVLSRTGLFQRNEGPNTYRFSVCTISI